MSIVNLQRDAVFLDTEKGKLSWGTAQAQTGDISTNTDATVWDMFAMATSSKTAEVIIADASHGQTIGVFLQPPIELTPYRVKAYVTSEDAALSFRLVFGYSTGTIDGSNDTVTDTSYIPLFGHIDELFIHPVPAEAGPIFFGIAARGITTGAIVHAHISVQRLATSPPQFSQAVS